MPVAAQAPTTKSEQQVKTNLAKHLDGSGLNNEDVNALINTLEDPDARSRLVEQLRILKSGLDAGSSTLDDNSSNAADKEGTGRLGGRVVERLSLGIDQISAQLVSGASMILDLPRLMDWATSQVLIQEKREIWGNGLWKILVVLAIGMFIERAIRLLLSRTRSAIEHQDFGGLWARLPLLVARTFIDIVPIAAFALGGYLVLPVLNPDVITRLVAISLLNALIIARIIMASARVGLAPRAANLRVLRLDDQTANYLFLWVRRFTNVTVYGYFLVEVMRLLGLPQGGYIAVVKIIGLLIALLLIIFSLQNRRAVAGWISGSETTGFTGLRMLRRRLGDIWHVLAVIYIGVVYLVWALEVPGGFEFIFRATLLSLVILSVAKLLIVGSQNAVDKGFGVRKEVIAQFPGLALRANRYFAILHTVITIAVVIVAAFAILEAWGVDASAWIASTTGRRVLGSFISSAFVIAVGVVFWELVSSVIERYLARGEEGEGKLSARAKTLLPLLRNALLVVISTIVGFIVLSEIGVNIGPLLAGAGVIGLAIGFGAQTLVKDVITGIFILAEDQFRVGDVVRVNDKSGLVEQITIRTIRLRDLGGNVHMIPFNSVDMVENMTKDFSRYVFDIGIAYKEDVDEVIDILRDLGEEMQADDHYGPLINKPIEIMGLDQFADSAVIIRARLTTQPIKQWEVGREFNRRMKRKFDELGIEIPFPQQTIYFGEDVSGEAPSGYIELREGSEKKRNDTPARAARRPRTDGVDNVADDGE